MSCHRNKIFIVISVMSVELCSLTAFQSGNHRSLVHDNDMIKLGGMLCNLVVTVSNSNHSLVFFQSCSQGSTRLSMIEEIPVKATDFANHTS